MKMLPALASCLVLLLCGCGDPVAVPPVAAKKPLDPEAMLRQEPSAAGVIATPKVDMRGIGLEYGFAASGVLKGRLYLGGGDVIRGEIVLSEYDLATNTTGEPLGLALPDAHGNFEIPFSLSAASGPRFLKLEARGVDYKSPVDGSNRRIAMLSAVFNGLPIASGQRIAVSPVTDAIFSRFRRQMQSDATPSSNDAFMEAVDMTRNPSGGIAWGLLESPVVIDGDGDQAKLHFLAWDEALRYDRVNADGYFSALSKDFEDGALDAKSGDGQQVAVVQESNAKSLLIPKTYFTEGFRAAAQRVQLCSRLDIARLDPVRIVNRCPDRPDPASVPQLVVDAR